jgi:THO complex subunit 4
MSGLDTALSGRRSRGGMRADQEEDRGRGGGGDRKKYDRSGSSYNPADEDNNEHPLNRSTSGNPQDGPQRGRDMGRYRSGPYDRPTEADEVDSWQHDLHDGGYSYQRRNGGGRSAVGAVQITIGNKSTGGTNVINVSALEADVTEEDLEDIFGTCGTIQEMDMNYDKHGKSKGKAEITFKTSAEAADAAKEYDGAEVDGKAMKVVQQGASTEVTKTRVVKKKGQLNVSVGDGERFVSGGAVQRRGRGEFGYRPARDFGGRFGGQGGGFRGSGGRGRGSGGARGGGAMGGKGARFGSKGKSGKGKTDATADDLDTEMDDYFKAAKKDDAADDEV